MPQTEIECESWLTRVVPEQVGKEENLRGAQALAWEGVESQLAGPTGLEWLRWAQPTLTAG